MVTCSESATGITPSGIALALGSANIIGLARERLRYGGIIEAVRQHDTAPLFDWLVEHFAFQGISDRAAATYQQTHGRIDWSDVQELLRSSGLCPRLRS